MSESSQIMMLMAMNTLGMSILRETLVEAARAPNGSDATNLNWRGKEKTACFMFIQGTGLEMLIAGYDLGYDADALRLSFNYYYNHQENGNGFSHSVPSQRYQIHKEMH